MHSALELRSPHIVNRLVETWPRAEEAARYLDELLFTTRQRPERHGFEESVWTELTFLNDLLRDRLVPTASPSGTDIWAIAWDAARKEGSATS